MQWACVEAVGLLIAFLQTTGPAQVFLQDFVKLCVIGPGTALISD